MDFPKNLTNRKREAEILWEMMELKKKLVHLPKEQLNQANKLNNKYDDLKKELTKIRTDRALLKKKLGVKPKKYRSKPK